MNADRQFQRAAMVIARTLGIFALLFCALPALSSDTPVQSSQTDSFVPAPSPIEGLFLGHIYWVSKEQHAIVVTPKKGMRRRFYFDSATRFLQGKVRLGLHELEPGDKVAIWYIGEGKTYLADKIFYVDGEYEREKYLPKSRRVSPADQEIPSVKRKRDSATPAAENAERDAGQ